MLILFYILLLDTTVSYSAERLFYDFEEDRILLLGSARVNYKNTVVLSDSLIYDTETRDVVAYKNPILCIDKDTTYGRNMAYNLHSRKGITVDGRSRVEKGWFEGRIVKMVAPKTLNVESGRFTTCNLASPHYYFWAKSLKVYVDDMVYAKPVVLFVQDIPVFFLPFWFFPIKKGRSSGLLYPQIGRNSTLGRYVKNIAYYWVISDYADLTVGVDYMEKKGVAVILSSAWLYKPRLSGNIAAQYVDENGVKRRWKAKLFHRHNLQDGTIIMAKGDFVSDESFNIDYEDNVVRELEQVLTSFISLSKRFGILSTGLVVRETRDIKTEKRWGDYPKITLSLPSMEAFGGHLSYSGVVLNSITQQDNERKSENNLRFTLPKKLWYFNVSPCVGARISLTDTEDGISAENFYDGSMGIGTVLYGRSIIRNPETRHTIRPSIHYSFSRFGDSYRRNLGVSVRNDFYLLFLAGRKINLGRADISTNWNFDNKRWNPVVISFTISPTRGISLRGGGLWNTYMGSVYGKYLVTTYTLSRGDFRATLTYNIREGSDESVWGSIYMNPTRGWRVEGGIRYDIRNANIINEYVSLKRDLHCWELQFNYQRYGERWNYDFKLRIKAIPEIKVGKEIVKMLLGD